METVALAADAYIDVLLRGDGWEVCEQYTEDVLGVFEDRQQAERLAAAVAAFAAEYAADYDEERERTVEEAAINERVEAATRFRVQEASRSLRLALYEVERASDRTREGSRAHTAIARAISDLRQQLEKWDSEKI